MLGRLREAGLQVDVTKHCVSSEAIKGGILTPLSSRGKTLLPRSKYSRSIAMAVRGESIFQILPPAGQHECLASDENRSKRIKITNLRSIPNKKVVWISEHKVRVTKDRNTEKLWHLDIRATPREVDVAT